MERPLLLLLLLPALITAASVDPETSRLLAEVNGGLTADVADADSVGQQSVSHHDYVGHYPAGLLAAEYGSALPFGARTRPVTEHPLNEHFRFLEKARRTQYGDIYTKHPKLQYKPKYYHYPKHEGVKYQKPKYEEVKYEGPKYESYKYEKPKYESYKYEKPTYETYKYEKPKYKTLKHKSHKYPRPEYTSHKYDSHKEYAPKPVYEAPTYHQEYEPYAAPESPQFFEPPPPHFDSPRHPLPPRYEAATGPEADYPVLPSPPTGAIHHLPPPPPPPPSHPVYPAPPESFHYTEEHHVTETYPVPAPYQSYPVPPPRGHRAGKALDRFSFNPDPYIETIAIAYHENQRNFNHRHRQPKHLVPEYEAPARYPKPHKYRPPHVQKYAPLAPEYGRHVQYAPPHASEYVAPHAKEHVALGGTGYGRLVGGRSVPERTVTLTPYRVQVGTLYGLSAAGSSLSETVVKGDSKTEGGEAKMAGSAKVDEEKKTSDSAKSA